MRYADLDTLIDKVKRLRDAHETMHLSFDALYRILNQADVEFDMEKVLMQVDEILKAEDIPDCVILDVAAVIYNGGKEVNED